MDDVQVLCDLEIDMAEARSTWQQVKSLFLADCLQSIQSNTSNPGRKGVVSADANMPRND